MAIELATAYVTLTTSAKGISDSVGKQLSPVTGEAAKVGDESGKKIAGGITAGSQKAAGGFKSSMKGLAGVAAGAFAVSSVTAFFGEAIEEAKESAKVSALTANIIKGTGQAAGISAEQVGDLAGEISAYAGIDDEAVQAGENLLLSFTNIKNAAGEGNDIFNQTTKAAVDMSVAMGTEVTGASKILGKSLNDPLKGLTALGKAGVSFTASQKEQVKAMVASGDILGAQKIILGEVTKRYGGAAEAAAAPTAKLTVAWDNFKEQIGTAVLPIIGKLADFMTENLVPALSATFGWIDRNSAVLGPIVGIIAALVAIWAVLNTVTAISTGVMGTFNAVMALNPVVLIVIAIVALVAALVLAYHKVEWFRDGVDAAFRWIKDAAVAVGQAIVVAWQWVSNAATVTKDWVVARWREMIAFFTGLPGKISAVASGMWNGLKDSAASAYNWVIGKISGIISYVTGMPSRVAGVLRTLFSPLYDSAAFVLRNIARAWNATLGGVSFTIPQWVPGLGGNSYSFPKMPSFARGGMLQPGWNLVGEQGAELIHKAGSSARVFSNSASQDLASGSSGQPVSIGRLVEFSGPVHVRSDQDILTLTREIGRETNRRLRSLGVSRSVSGATA